METTNFFTIDDEYNERMQFIHNQVAEALDKIDIKRINEMKCMLAKIMKSICDDIKEILEDIHWVFHSVNISSHFAMTQFTYSSNFEASNTMPRSPPSQSIKEKIEMKYLLYKIKYGKYVQSVCKYVVENELYNIARTIVIMIFKLIFHF